jgi:superfamily I DNA/RNA helicase
VTSPVDALLHSDAPLVVIEAAAGCGKTWTAAKFAREMSHRLDSQRVLLLSHTHAACGEFHRRCEGQGLRIEVETCDSFALKVVAPYAAALGLPFPLDSSIGRQGGVSFTTLGVKAVELVQRSPSIAQLISAQYPTIILDEHQDATVAQHELVMTLMRVGGSRLRIFGDPMQALHYGSADRFVDWNTLWGNCDARLELTAPKRWAETPALGQWITATRATLRAGGRVVMRDASREVQFRTTTGLAGRNKFKDHRLAGEILRGFLDAGAGPAVVIAHLSGMIRALAQSANWRARINEGAILEHLDQLLGDAEAEKIDASTLASAFATFVTDIGSGLTKAMRARLNKRAGIMLDQGRAGTNQEAWLAILAAIYADPSYRGLAAAMELLARAPPDGYRIRLGDHASALRALRHTADPRSHLQALSRLRRRRSLPGLSVSTVHKAKGLEFRRVLVCPADQQQYPASAYGARLLYVAMSRATHELFIVADTAASLSHLDFEVSAR